jgi:hypothetical protein
MDRNKEIMTDWNHDISCMLMSLPVSDLENFKGLILTAQSVQHIRMSS